MIGYRWGQIIHILMMIICACAATQLQKTSGTHSWVLKLMSHYNLHIFSSYILIPETPYVLSSTLRPNLAKQICGQAEVVICLQPLRVVMSASSQIGVNYWRGCPK